MIVRRVRQWAAVVLVLLLTACAPAPGVDQPTPLDDLIARLITGLAQGTLTDVPTNDPGADAELAEILAGMGEFHPAVTAGPPRETGTDRQVTLSWDWNLAGNSWSYQTVATLTPGETEAWQLRWGASIVHPQLTGLTRLVHGRTPAPRGMIRAANHDPLTALLPVTRIGIDKSRMDDDQTRDSATRLAQALDLDVDAYVERVMAAGDQAWVEAITLRGRGQNIPDAAYDIPGVLLQRDDMVLETVKGRAGGLIGTVGEATAELIEGSQGRIRAGDQVGLSGLQRRHDDTLRGVAGSTVRLVARESTEADVEPVELFTAAPVAGRDLTVSLDLPLQDKADEILAGVTTDAAVAVVRPSTGAVLALSSHSSDGQPLANFGRFPPGSTFKIASALALVRQGLGPDSPLDCPATITVEGRTFTNYSDFPTSRVGAMTLADAIATSCNTALIGQHASLSGIRLREAAISLGVGADHDVGFPAFYGEVPDPVDTVGLAAAIIGQGTVEASPMAMAGLAASVAAGHTVLPWLLSSNQPTPTGTPLTEDEADALQQMMAETVRSGTAQSLQGIVVGAKSGTAEYGTANPPDTHAWMIAWTDDDLAIAVLVTDATSGARDAAPIIRDLLS